MRLNLPVIKGPRFVKQVEYPVGSSLDKFLEKVRTRPPRANIAKVEEVWSEAKGEIVGFELVTR